MSNKDFIEVEGVVKEVLPDMRYRVEIGNGAVVMGYLSGRMKTNKIRVLTGDKVKMEMTPYDLTKGRITFREK